MYIYNIILTDTVSPSPLPEYFWKTKIIVGLGSPECCFAGENGGNLFDRCFVPGSHYRIQSIGYWQNNESQLPERKLPLGVVRNRDRQGRAATGYTLHDVLLKKTSQTSNLTYAGIHES